MHAVEEDSSALRELIDVQSAETADGDLAGIQSPEPAVATNLLITTTARTKLRRET